MAVNKGAAQGMRLAAHPAARKTLAETGSLEAKQSLELEG